MLTDAWRIELGDNGFGNGKGADATADLAEAAIPLLIPAVGQIFGRELQRACVKSQSPWLLSLARRHYKRANKKGALADRPSADRSSLTKTLNGATVALALVPDYDAPMPTLQKFAASRVVMYAGDHLLPHVHVQLSDGRECTVELGSLAIVGRIAAREIRDELRWIESNRVWLHDEWQRYNP
jgi:hypothetical protein